MRVEARRRHRIRLLLGALYREELRTGVIRAYRRRAGGHAVASLFETALRVQERMIGLLLDHLRQRGVEPPGAGSPLRRAMRGMGAVLGGVIALGGTQTMLRRFRAEERRTSERYGDEVDWTGWSRSERETLDGHRCDLLYQDHWAEQLLRDRSAGKPAKTA